MLTPYEGMDKINLLTAQGMSKRDAVMILANTYHISFRTIETVVFFESLTWSKEQSTNKKGVLNGR